ncbi:MAG: DUF58 domain-containing protein [Actinomycetota bacterium]
MKLPSPLTSASAIVVLLGFGAWIGGWLLGWVELMVVAAGCLVALTVATPFVLGRLRLDVTRSLEPNRVMVGEQSIAVLDIANPRRSPIRPRMIEDAVDGVAVPIEVPGLPAGGGHQAVFNLPTRRRGVVAVGPAVIARRDPLHLLRREVRQTDGDTLWVHPRYTPLNSLPVGYAKDLEGPTSDASPAGDVAFHALRDYEPGDDFRHIHWLSTARVGAPVVRHYVDNRRPQITVLLDDRAGSYLGDEFEVAVEIVASLAVSSMLHREPVAVWTTNGPMLGQTKPGGRDDALDRLAVIQPGDGADLDRAAVHATRQESGTSAIVIVTGAIDPASLTLAASQARRHARVIIVRVWQPDALVPTPIPGAKTIDAESLDQFRAAWNGTSR